MSNYSELSRKEQVLHRLQENDGAWVDGTELATAEVGGSEGLKRLRELRNDGYPIEKRKHPDPTRDIYQYRLGGPPVRPSAAEVKVLNALKSGPKRRGELVTGTGLDLDTVLWAISSLRTRGYPIYLDADGSRFVLSRMNA